MHRFYSAGLLLVLGICSATPTRAQDADGWSAIVVPTLGSGSRRTVAPTGAAATLQPNAATPSGNQHLKTAGRPLTDVLPGILKLRPLQYAYLPGQGTEGTHYGISPAELAKVYPQLVKTDLMTGVQSINTSQLTPILIEAIKEQQQQIAVLQQQQLQLAQVYAQLVQSTAGHSASNGGFLRRPRAGTAKKDTPRSSVTAADSVSLVP